MTLFPEFDLMSATPDVQIPRDQGDPRNLLGHFLVGEVSLRLSYVQQLVDGLKSVRAGIAPNWKWHGNMFTVEVYASKCIVINFVATPKEQASLEEQAILSTVELSHEQFVEMLTRWKEYVEEFDLITY